MKRKDTIKKLQRQQKALVKSAYGSKKIHRERIQKQYAEECKRMKLYSSKKKHKKALQTGKLRKRKKKNGRRRRDIINRINALFR